MNNITIILIHGNGNSTPHDNWIPYVKTYLEKEGYRVVAPQFPDTPLARQQYWLPFLKKEIKADHNSILIGHSTGAVAAMRFAENNRLLGSILVGACITDLGVETEKLSGYFDQPWNWQAIKNNQQWIIQFASTDDPWIPVAEPRELHRNLATEYHEYTNQGHFGGHYHKQTFPELVDALKKKLVSKK
jgi:predicted alpha/beta hydrolase family esterase